ncbi:MAG: EAL domain-containing protein [Burkholderiales bacterium]|nr:EAL domain-containing protein [Burkholderiales bacterium]MCP5303553.1 EAL domain-containing protein [Pseudomonadales bacterium]MDR4516570.1 EAL domain-containing protein [Nitrosomonas sp.]
MKKPLFHPITRLSISLVALAISILLVGELLGIVPDKSQIALNARKHLSESLAVQFTLAAEQKNFKEIEITLKSLVERNPEILSGAIRKADGSLLVTTENHEQTWQGTSDGRSTWSSVQVPIAQGNQLWGTVELSYAPVYGDDIYNIIKNSIWGIAIFVLIVGFYSFRFILKRTLKELNPSNVIPERVKSAFDTLTEGVLILDAQGQIVMANNAFSNITGIDFDRLLGKYASDLGWGRFSVEQMKPDWMHPWLSTIKNGNPETDTFLTFNCLGEVRILSTNCSPIMGGDECKGVLVTFDDVTEFENNNQKLKNMLTELELSKVEISRQNNELKMLAEIDPLTGCYNRRALFLYFKKAFEEAVCQKANLFCIMLDIDHFKAVNDTYGHQTGDEVIKLVAAIIKENLRENDLVGRYGGEEFCLVLPDIDADKVLKIAERIRVNVMESKEYHAIGIDKVTISLGISSTQDNAQNPNEMIDLADKALYFAKKNGRNRVIVWTDDVIDSDENQVEIASEPASENDSSGSSTDNSSLITDNAFLHARIKELETLDKEKKAALQYYLNYDAVTGLPSHALLRDRLQALITNASRTKRKIALLSLKFNPYRRINSTLGHKSAEKLIIEITRRLTEVLRSSDTISSDTGLGISNSLLSRKNDENFYIVVPGIQKDQTITWIVNRVRNVFDQPVKIEDINIQVDSMIGVSVFPTDERHSDNLIKFADQARDCAELMGKNSCQFYSEKMNGHFFDQLNTESEIMNAIKHNEFEVYYQPIVDITQGRINKVEALLRWNHPKKGLLTPASFIEVAEESELIVSLGEWALRESVRQLAKWRSEFSTDISISVNLSTIQFRQKDLAKKIIECLHENGVPAKNLILEITESTIMQDMERTITIIKELNDLGVKIALDDFGTGYSSLQYIHKLPVDIIKIDSSFIQEIKPNTASDSIVSLIIDMARRMGFSTVAEGVETENQYYQLSKLKCDEIQGYFISRPITNDDMYKMLETQTSRVNEIKLKLAV